MTFLAFIMYYGLKIFVALIGLPLYDHQSETSVFYISFYISDYSLFIVSQSTFFAAETWQ